MKGKRKERGREEKNVGNLREKLWVREEKEKETRR